MERFHYMAIVSAPS